MAETVLHLLHVGPCSLCNIYTVFSPGPGAERIRGCLACGFSKIFFFLEKAVFMTMVKQPQLYIGVFIDYMAGVNWGNFVFIIFN